MKKPAQLRNAVRCALRPELVTRPGKVRVTILYSVPLSRDDAFYTYQTPYRLETLLYLFDPFIRGMSSDWVFPSTKIDDGESFRSFDAWGPS